MTQARRRIAFCVIIVVLIIAGAILQAIAADKLRPDFSSISPAAPNVSQAEKSGEAILEGLACITFVVGLQLPLAEKACSAAIDLRPDDPLGYKYRGFTHLLQHRFERAEMDFRDATRLDPKDAGNHAGYGQSLSGQGRFREAVQQFNIALGLSPRDANVLSARAWARAGEGKDLAAAVKDCELALKLKPRSSVALDSRALVHLRAGRNRLALEDYSSSLTWHPGGTVALFGRGVTEFRLGHMTAARNDLSLARRNDPEIDDIFIMVGVLEAGCHDGKDTCSLPEGLRAAPQTGSGYLSVSF